MSVTRWFVEAVGDAHRLPPLPAVVHWNCIRFLVLEPLVDGWLIVVALLLIIAAWAAT